MKRIAVLCLFALLAGCASVRSYFEDPMPGYWRDAGPGAQSYEWHVKSKYDVITECGSGTPACSRKKGDVAHVYSTMTEGEARGMFFAQNGLDIAEHEFTHWGLDKWGKPTKENRAKVHD